MHGFYDNTVVLITGGTGFIGKVLVEKLLRSFTIRTIYLLIRSKNARSVDDRLHEFFEESVGIRATIAFAFHVSNTSHRQIFDRLRVEKPHMFAKVVAIDTDFDAPDLNIDRAYKAQIESDVQVG